MNEALKQALSLLYSLGLAFMTLAIYFAGGARRRTGATLLSVGLILVMIALAAGAVIIVIEAPHIKVS